MIFSKIAFAALALCMSFTACSDDDDDDAKGIDGTYTGKHTALMLDGYGKEYILPDNDAAQAKQTDNGDGTITISTPDWALGTGENALVYTGYDLTLDLEEDGTFSQHWGNNIKSISLRSGNVVEFAAQLDGTVDEAKQSLTYKLELNHASSHFIITFDGKK